MGEGEEKRIEGKREGADFSRLAAVTTRGTLTSDTNNGMKEAQERP